jgi:hypothetical protein
MGALIFAAAFGTLAIRSTPLDPVLITIDEAAAHSSLCLHVLGGGLVFR